MEYSALHDSGEALEDPAIAPQDPGPSVVTASSNVANGSRPVVYPPRSVPNPVSDLSEIRHDPILGQLQRPKLVPEDLDSRIDRQSVWMAVVPDTAQAVYFVPGSCTECVKLAQHCTRGEPCARCSKRGVRCELGGMKHFRLAPSQPPKEEVFTAEEKGKGRADGAEEMNGEEDEEGGRGHRVKKKRRLSASDEVDPNTLSWDGTPQKKPRARPRPSARQPVAYDGPLRPEDVRPTLADMECEPALLANSERDPLHDLRGFCPIWADRRHALAAASEHFRDPVRVDGASVSISTSGVARGVVFDSTPVDSVKGSYFGTDDRAGSIITSIGGGRARRGPGRGSEQPTANGDGPASAPTAADTAEEPVVQALIMAQRAGIPVAVGVSQASPIVPFKVPRDTIVLGWFWVVDAWTELALASNTTVVWRFRFEWCAGEQKAEWWLPKDVAERRVTLLEQGRESPVVIRGPGASSPTTRRGSTEAPSEDEGDQQAPVRCDTCHRYSDHIYEAWDLCLNENCEQFCRPNTKRDEGTPQNNTPCIRGTYNTGQHHTPEECGLSLLPPDASTVLADTRREDAQQDLWRAWVCKRCRMANERRDWFGFLCEACSYLEVPTRKVYSSEALRPPSRPVCTGPRPDEGYPNWGPTAVRSPATFPDGVKAVTHNLDGDLGIGTRLSHLFNHEDVSQLANEVLHGLQMQGDDEVRFRREMLSAKSCRVSELVLCPFYTFLAGPEPAYIPQLPWGIATPWADAPKAVKSAIDHVNERSGRVCKDTKEFNSLLLAAVPPTSASVAVPIARNSLVAILVLGCDVLARFKRVATGRRLAGQVTAQHGDVLVVRTGSEDVEVDLKPEGFGFLGIAQRVYPADTAAPKAPQTPLAPWYIGDWPCDPTQPLRPQAPQRDPTVVDTVDASELLQVRPFRGQAIRPEPQEPKVKAAPSSGALPGSKQEDGETGRRGGRGGGRGRGRGRGGASPSVAASSPRTVGKGRQGRGRPSASHSASASASGALDEAEGGDMPTGVAEQVEATDGHEDVVMGEA